MTINIFMYIYIGENAHRDIYAPPCKSLHKKKFHFLFYFRCILLQRSHKKYFFISISILGRSGVNRSVITVHTNLFAKKNASCINLQLPIVILKKSIFQTCVLVHVYLYLYMHTIKNHV